ncbi:hypothetical protein PTE30175_02543 [Pandoraea terrae]|uniref:Uncharacterized protein n=1 Tax=Pandoraea terrae TaxID=1537710 RepID=A0A5E4VFT4_9BURK|nr:hypothetical protein [Pandoraea terrae]VVE10643.1 hypothetical protein PTE30175_02543 [Pandoraea terrae]
MNPLGVMPSGREVSREIAGLVGAPQARWRMISRGTQQRSAAIDEFYFMLI